MKEERVHGEAVGTNVRLECGHCLELPWGLAPEAAIADLLQHRASCRAAADDPAGDGFPFSDFVRPLEAVP